MSIPNWKMTNLNGIATLSIVQEKISDLHKWKSMEIKKTNVTRNAWKF